MIKKELMDDSIELNPLYNKVEYELSRVEDDSDPLGIEQKNQVINWADLIRDIDQLLSQKQDVQVLVWKLRASLYTEGFSSLYKYLRVIYDLIAEIKSEESLTNEEMDVLGTFSSALSWLSTVLCATEVRDANLYPEEKLSIRFMLDFDIKTGENNFLLADLVSTEKKADEYFLENNLPILKEQIKENIKYLNKISEYVNDHSSGYTLDCHNLSDLLARLSFKVNSINEINLGSDSFNDDSGFDTSITNERQEPKNYSFKKSVQNRNEVIVALENILNYFQVYEPSHPAPILIRRVQKMIGMNFESIIEELLPDSQESLKLYLGRKSDNSDEQGNEQRL